MKAEEKKEGKKRGNAKKQGIFLRRPTYCLPILTTLNTAGLYIENWWYGNGQTAEKEEATMVVMKPAKYSINETFKDSFTTTYFSQEDFFYIICNCIF